MYKHEKLMDIYNDLEYEETDRLPSFQSGCYMNGVVYLKPKLDRYKMNEVLAEEVAHHELTYGDITDQTQFNNRKFEGYARKRAYELLVPLTGIIDAFKQGYHSLYEMAIFFDVSESFVQQCLEHYKIKHGLSTLCGDYLIQFSPLRVFEYKKLENGRNVE